MPTNAKAVYWNGDLKVVINEMTLYGTKFSDNEQVRSFMNFAFELFYNCRQGIADCQNTKMRKAMTSELEDAATEGAGRGVDDLKEAIEHAVEQKAKGRFSDPFQWYSDKTETYACVQHDPQRVFDPYDTRVATLWQGGSVSAPKSTVMFVREMDKRFQELGGAAKPYDKTVNALQGIIKKRNASSQDWKKLGERLQAAGDAASEVQKWMWLAPSKLSGYDRYLGGSARFLDVANKIKSVGDNYVHYGRADLAIAEELLGYLPILGGFYAKALHMMPGLEQWFKTIVQNRINRIDAVFREKSAGISKQQSGMLAANCSVPSNAIHGTSSTFQIG